MHPILVTIGPFTVYTYGVMLVIAFTVATWLAARAARRLPPAQAAISAQPLVDFAKLRSGRAFLLERPLRRKDGTSVSVEVSTRMLGDGRLRSHGRDVRSPLWGRLVLDCDASNTDGAGRHWPLARSGS